jgi:hypothetical protein
LPLKKNFRSCFSKKSCLENKFWNVFSEFFLNLKYKNFEKRIPKFFLRAKLEYWEIEKICEWWEENFSCLRWPYGPSPRRVAWKNS